MRIAIAARGVTKGFSGPNEFIKGLIRALPEETSPHQFHVYYDAASALGLSPGSQEHVLGTSSRLVWDHILLPQALGKDGIDVAIFPKGPTPLHLPCKAIPIIHDLGYFYPSLRAYKPLETLYMKLNLRYAAYRAWGIFAVSEYTRQDVIRIFHTPPEKVVTIYEAPDDHYRRIEDPVRLDNVRRCYALEEPFIFYPTSISPRKNISRVLDAFEAIFDTIPHHLYFTGSLQWNASTILQRLQGPISKRVHLLGAVPPDDMPVLYSLAEFVIYPSLFEGFGLPVVEAFRCGAPVLISNLTSLPEIADDAALIVDGYNTEAIKEGILRMADDKHLREELVARGYKRAKAFTWKRTANIILRWLEEHTQPS